MIMGRDTKDEATTSTLEGIRHNLKLKAPQGRSGQCLLLKPWDRREGFQFVDSNMLIFLP
jgi:hypothetical protein